VTPRTLCVWISTWATASPFFQC